MSWTIGARWQTDCFLFGGLGFVGRGRDLDAKPCRMRGTNDGGGGLASYEL